MGKLLRLICMAAILTMFAGCNNGDDPEPQPVQETWLMTYDDYHALLDIPENEKQKYKDLIREVTILRDGDEISIRGIFLEYPDSWVKGVIRGDKVFIGNSQAIGTEDGETVYFHWFCVSHYSEHKYLGNTSVMLPEYIEFYGSTGNSFIISDGGNTMIEPDSESGIAFLYDKDNGRNIYYHYSEDTGFPDVDIKVNISFRKVSDTKAGSK